MSTAATTPASPTPDGPEWWRTAVIYQIYPRSFADGDGDGMGDLAGIASRLDDLSYLGIDAIWLSPFFVSPQRDAGYDVADYRDVDPRFGTLADMDALIAAAHERGIRVIADIVPNHTSSDHVWFQAALASAPGSVERDRYLFKDGKGPDGSEPPTDWLSVFGGSAWTRITEADGTPGQWYLHLFDESQPDLNWDNQEVVDEFDSVLRFWLDRGIDGFRVDVAHGMVKDPAYPDHQPKHDPEIGGGGIYLDCPYFGQPGVHRIWRHWRTVIDEYDGDRILTAESWVHPMSELANYTRPDEYHQAFNFPFMFAGWDAAKLRSSIDESLQEFGTVGAPSTWVLSNHDVVRHASRFGLEDSGPQGSGIGPRDPQPDEALGLRRARAAALMMLALPGSVFVYQGEELGLPEATQIPEDARQDPTWFRTGGEKYGRDGCRVPIPWEAGAPAYGFSPTGASWLPQPEGWDTYARSAQTGVDGSTLELYRAAMAARTARGTSTADLTWIEGLPTGVLGFTVADVAVYVNTSDSPAAIDDDGDVVLASEGFDGTLEGNTAVWLQR